MKYYGTRDNNKLYELKSAALLGLAPCGGLFMPEKISQIDMDVVKQKAKISFAEMSTYILSKIFDDLSVEKLKEVTEKAFNFEVPLNNVGDELYTLELFHGPTLAFKDFGARFMGQMLSLLKGDKKITILTATSGDTGSAVAAGFYGIKDIEVIVLYPKGRVSDFQERQMTTLGKNIKALCVDGTFDDCQRLVKEVFNNHKFCEENNVTSANSISILRWVPQSLYYFYGYCKWCEMGKTAKPTVVVPSGNYGNVTAGMLAKRMGLPIKRFIAATNENRAIPNFLKSGIYAPCDTVQTVSNAMDVGNPSNYERLVDLYGSDIEAIRADLKSYSYSDTETVDAIKYLYDKYGYISDPHSAVGYMALKESEEEGFWISTAHCSKFESVVKDMAGIDANTLPESMNYLFEKPKMFTEFNPKKDDLKMFISIVVQ